MPTPIRSLAVAVLALPLLAGSAHADPRCIYHPDDLRLEVWGDPAFSGFTLATVPQPSGAAAITMTGLSPLGVVPIDCGAATLANVSAIVATGFGEGLELDASQAPFPAASIVAGTWLGMSLNSFSTVDYVAPAGAPATITAGTYGIDVSGDGLPDIYQLGASTLEIHGSPLDDTISAQGGGQSGRPLPASIGFAVDPGTGDDVVRGHRGPDWINLGQASAGEADGYGGSDTLIGGHGGPYVLNGGAGDDALTANANATTLKGGGGNDTFTLAAGAHAVSGAGDDVFLAQNGQADIVNGGSGNDTAFVDYTGDRVTAVETVNAGT